MATVERWTGRHAAALRGALRLTNEAFAARLGIAIRTVAKWNANPAMVPTPELQGALDTLLGKAPPDARDRFLATIDTGNSPSAIGLGSRVTTVEQSENHSDTELRLATDRQFGLALEWLDRWAGWGIGAARTRLTQAAEIVDLSGLQDQSHRRGQVKRTEIAHALHDFYALPDSDLKGYRVRSAGNLVATSIATQSDWLDLQAPLGGVDEAMRFSASPSFTPPSTAMGVDKAIARLAELLTAGLRVPSGPLYRLLDVQPRAGQLAGQFGIADFLTYALTMDVLESELIDALALGLEPARVNLPLRSHYLPDTSAVLNVAGRICAGGPLALTAIARPGHRSRGGRPDYLLLVQERSGRVLNAARKLAVIPKGFHEPLTDFAQDASISSTLEREMEEELFGRDDVDSTNDLKSADPMHPSRLSGPMRWLFDNSDAWRMECTGFGFNLVSGNFEFASLVLIEDERWWSKFGGQIEANWESDSLQRYSTLDSDLISVLIADEAWSNEGLFAFLQGLRRLREVGGDRVDLPNVELELW